MGLVGPKLPRGTESWNVLPSRAESAIWAAGAAQGHIVGTGPDGGEPDLAHRPRQPSDGGAYACCGGLHPQVAVDAKHKLIVEQLVTNQVVDMGLLGTVPS